MRGKRALELLSATLPGLQWHACRGRDELGNKNGNERFEVTNAIGEAVAVAIEEIRVDSSTYVTNQHTYRVEVGCYVGEAVGILHAAQRVRERLGMLHRTLDGALAPVRPTRQRVLGVLHHRERLAAHEPAFLRDDIKHTELAEPAEHIECKLCGKYFEVQLLDEVGRCPLCADGVL